MPTDSVAEVRPTLRAPAHVRPAPRRRSPARGRSLLPPPRRRRHPLPAPPRPGLRLRMCRLRVDGRRGGRGHRRPRPRVGGGWDVSLRKLWHACHCPPRRILCRRPRGPEGDGSHDSREGGPVRRHRHDHARRERRPRAARPIQALRHCQGAGVRLLDQSAPARGVAPLHRARQALVFVLPRAHEVRNLVSADSPREPPPPLQPPPEIRDLAPHPRRVAAKGGAVRGARHPQRGP
mmetsp:Transcript_19084/g.48191  ORF Transcript_19084/g.48191 Transcript_19084/m.48191 type:complete len:235 (+) Transcript_19084:382-1086(+)